MAPCKQTIDLDVGNDFKVSSSNAKTCSPQWTGMRACLVGKVAAPQAQWSLHSATGSIDPDAAVMELQIDGERVGGPDVSYPGGKQDRARTTALFPRALSIGPDDNAMRVFGSMTDSKIMGNQTTFELRAR